MAQADECATYENNFMESIDDIKIAIELKSKEEAKFFRDEAYSSLLDLSAVCSQKYRKTTLKSFRKILHKQKIFISKIK